MASYTKRGKTWQYTISIKDKGTNKYNRITKGGFRTKTEAINAATEKELLLKQGYRESTNVLLADYFAEWMEIYKKPAVSSRTFTKYETTLNSIKKYFENVTLSQLNKKMYQQTINNYAAEHAPESTSKFNNHIRQCIKNAVEEKLILDNFTNNAVISGTNNVKRKEDKFLNYEDTKRVISYFKDRLNPKLPSYYMIILAFTTGLRYGELLGLTWEDIDFKNNRIDINKSYDYHTHSGFKDTKTYSSCRTIHIDDSTANMLKAFKDDQQQLFEQFKVINPLNQVFYHYIEGIVSNNAVNQSLRRALRQMDIIPLITMHGARHTFGSILIYKVVDLAVVSEILGHKDTLVTSKVYIHVIKELREKSKLKINNITMQLYN
ncbi:tyrosine-type recombinase/integrase [Bacillus badius]|uniref:tyrosine-type recombinase/integrase n=1 Tax=Bacillus badius TaxID=1455 RepID=UPI001CC0D3C8|nr:tyrosine-type recombinase/integrase [Bacillus badius]UAT31311.1 tyrosine-type recombinase/integrase [Bacillus badius]